MRATNGLFGLRCICYVELIHFHYDTSMCNGISQELQAITSSSWFIELTLIFLATEHEFCRPQKGKRAKCSTQDHFFFCFETFAFAYAHISLDDWRWTSCLPQFLCFFLSNQPQHAAKRCHDDEEYKQIHAIRFFESKCIRFTDGKLCDINLTTRTDMCAVYCYLLKDTFYRWSPNISQSVHILYIGIFAYRIHVWITLFAGLT